MLGHAMDFYIPDVSLEQIRFAGLRLQRGGVGFYPTSGSPFVHLDTGSIRHWPRMTHDQLARVFPDGRTVHVPADGVPLSGYELARADIERRENGAPVLTRSKPSLLAALFGVKSNDDEDEGASVAMAADKSGLSAAAASAKSAEAVPVPRAKPRAATFQLASADAQLLQPARARQTAANQAEAKPQTPADIINSRGFWDDVAAAPKQASPAQVAAISARRALNAADPQPTASVPATLDALAYAPLSSTPAGRSNAAAAGAPIPRSPQLSTARTPAGMVDTIAARGPQGQDTVPVAASARLAASVGNDVWIRVMILARSASNSMNTTVLGDTDMASMRRFFIKPASVVAMSFSGDPQMGMLSDRFTGSATAALATRSFVLRTASLR
jgi:hypothetical protein